MQLTEPKLAAVEPREPVRESAADALRFWKGLALGLLIILVLLLVGGGTWWAYWHERWHDQELYTLRKALFEHRAAIIDLQVRTGLRQAPAAAPAGVK